MRLLAFSDLHHSRPKAEALVRASRDADLVIGAGDFCNMRERLDGALALLAGIEAPVALVPGNAESEAELRAAAHAGWTVLHGAWCSVCPSRGWPCACRESVPTATAPAAALR